MSERASDFEQLAAKLGRPPTVLAGFSRLSADQIGLLSDLVDAARARERETVDSALAQALPLVPVRPLLELTRRRAG